MNKDASILLGDFEEFIWLRCAGKGNFVNSPLLKQAADAAIAGGRKLLVADLEKCEGMDSTFMGTLAGIAIKIERENQGALHIANASQRNRDALEELGLNLLMKINPTDAPWIDHMQRIQTGLNAYESEKLSAREQTQFCLDAHRTLGQASAENINRFRMVVEMFERDLSDKEK